MINMTVRREKDVAHPSEFRPVPVFQPTASPRERRAFDVLPPRTPRRSDRRRADRKGGTDDVRFEVVSRRNLSVGGRFASDPENGLAADSDGPRRSDDRSIVEADSVRAKTFGAVGRCRVFRSEHTPDTGIRPQCPASSRVVRHGTSTASLARRVACGSIYRSLCEGS